LGRSSSGAKVISESNELKAWTLPYQEVKERFSNVQSLLPEAEESGDQTFVEDLLKELDGIEKNISELEIRRMLSGEMDSKIAI
jgi:peptide chain release factor 2